MQPRSQQSSRVLPSLQSCLTTAENSPSVMVLRPSVSKDSKSFALQHSSRMPNEVYPSAASSAAECPSERREKMFRSCHAHQPNLLTTVRDACCSISTTDRSFGSSSTARSAGCESQRARSCAGITSSPSTSAQQACLCQMSRGLKSQRSTALVEAVQWRRRNSTPSISRQSVRISFRPDRTPTSDPRPVPERARHMSHT